MDAMAEWKPIFWETAPLVTEAAPVQLLGDVGKDVELIRNGEQWLVARRRKPSIKHRPLPQVRRIVGPYEPGNGGMQLRAAAPLNVELDEW